MAVSDINKTSFGTDPKKGMEVIDAYDKQKIEGFLADVAGSGEESKLVSELFPELKPDVVAEAVNDTETKSFLAETGTSILDLVKAVNRSLPPGVSLRDLIPGMSLPEALKFTERLKQNLSNNEWLDIDTQFYLKMYRHYEKLKNRWSENGDWAEYLAGLAKGTLNGILAPTGVSVDFLLDAAYKLGVVDYMMEKGHAADIISWIRDSSLPESVKKWVYDEMVTMAGESGNYDLIPELISLAADKFEPWKRKITLRSILLGYRKPRGYKLADAETEAKNLNDVCKDVLDNWWLEDRNGRQVFDTYFMQFATIDALDVLRYDPDVGPLASFYYATRPEMTNWKYPARDHWPFLILE